MEYNIYCDESCHIEHDHNDVMILGGVWCEKDKSAQINSDLMEIRMSYGLKKTAELKWTKVSPSLLDYYKELVDYFFNNKYLSFRGYIARGKKELDHDSHNQQYDEWYYKMYYHMLTYIIDQDTKSSYSMYLDIKDTIGNEKVKKLHEILSNKYFSTKVNIDKIQLVKSEDVVLVQFADLFIGALSYRNRNLKSSDAKLSIVEKIESKNGTSMFSSVPLSNMKANWYVWTPDHWR